MWDVCLYFSARNCRDLLKLNIEQMSIVHWAKIHEIDKTLVHCTAGD